ncbi:ABC transporter substrate-binding protein [Tomitella gaofuii]|uniref:ABC transporter substrate-binding protein n=1 Tax=Tomitella gaofuii TaxID=2760083 RepID=UPI002E2DA746|nr:ABC transporter substrate-binding protein [Tomitella gaofuii]
MLAVDDARTRRRNRNRSRAAHTAVALTATGAVLAGCSAQATDPSATPSRIVLADAQPLGDYNPVNGYGELGVSPLYDGLLRPASTSDRTLPDLIPALAAAPPTPNADSTVWDVELRRGVAFSDGSAFDAADVVATYDAVLDPASASEIAASYTMIDEVTAVDDHHVRFTLDYPYYAFPARLTLGIAPSEELDGGPAVESPLNTRPVGTGPYRLTELTPTEARFEANPDYFDGAPEVTELVTVYTPDDNARAQQMRAGGIDGTVLPPVLAETFTGADGMRVDAVQSADWRGVSLPAGNPFTSDGRARRAMNLAVDRQAMIDDVLAGHGRAASTPVAAVYGDAFAPDAVFPHDPERARRILDDAGWIPAADGIRARGADRAAFTVYYPAEDTVRRDLAAAFASDMHRIGIDVRLQGSTWDVMNTKIDTGAFLLGGGDKPYDLDTQIYGALHTRSPRTATYDNPSGFAIPGVDEALDDARRSLDPQRRADDYRAVQAAYVAHPTYVFLAFLDHTYVSREDGWNRGSAVMEPHSHGVSWGPWWNLARWRR